MNWTWLAATAAVGIAIGVMALPPGQAERTFDAGGDHVPIYLRLDDSLEQVAAAFNTTGDRYSGADVASYIEAALQLRFDSHPLDQTYSDSWPPGLPLVIAALGIVTGHEAYPRKMIALNALVWATCLLGSLWVLGLGLGRARLALGVLGALGWLAFPTIRRYLLGFGAVGTEGLSNALFVAGVSFLLGGTKRESRRMLLAGGALLGAATLVRTYFEPITAALTLGAAMGLSIWTLFTCWRQQRALRATIASARIDPRLKLAASFGLAFLVAQSVLVPWRVYKQVHYKRFELYSAPRAFSYRFFWYYDHQLPGFVRGANAACHADPVLCERVQAEFIQAKPPRMSSRELEALTLQTLRSHPLGWYKLKLRDLDWLWLNDEWTRAKHKRRAEIVETILILALALAGTGLAGRRIRQEPTALHVVIGLLTIAFFAGNFLIFTRLHFEWRYSISMKLFCYFLPFWVLATTRAPRRAQPGF